MSGLRQGQTEFQPSPRDEIADPSGATALGQPPAKATAGPSVHNNRFAESALAKAVRVTAKAVRAAEKLQERFLEGHAMRK